MSFVSDMKVLYHLAVRPIRGTDHAERMDSFYAGQAEAYDEFRRRLLQGRQEMWSAIDVPSGGRWVDMGGGTGSNLEYFTSESPIEQLERIYVVDLAESLLGVAKQRAHERDWNNVEVVEADATRFRPAGEPVDVVTFSYSLTMIPDWFAALENAWEMLRPGGTIGVVDFYVSRKYPAAGMQRHSWFTRNFWPVWMSSDNVFPSSDHVAMLDLRFQRQSLSEELAKVPYLPWIRAPYYIFVGQKK